MGTEQEQDRAMEGMLRRVSQAARPADSWQGLRGRIEGRLEPHHPGHAVRRWRRTALALAACLVVTLGSLCYVVMRPERGVAAPAPLLTQGQLQRLTAVFEQVRGVFADEAAWFVVDSAGRTQIGVSGPRTPGRNEERIVVVRMALFEEGLSQAGAYVDVIARAQRVIDLQVPLRDGGVVRLSLVAELDAAGAVTLQTRQLNDGLDVTMGPALVPDASYASLGRIRAGERWLNLRATARVVPI